MVRRSTWAPAGAARAHLDHAAADRRLLAGHEAGDRREARPVLVPARYVQERVARGAEPEFRELLRARGADALLELERAVEVS